MHILFATPELEPYSRSSEIAAASRHIPAELKLSGADISIIAPLPKGEKAHSLKLAERLTQLRVPVDGKVADIKVYEGRTPESVRVFFLEHPVFKGLYGEGEELGLAAAAFSRAICEFMAHFAFPVDIVHCNGWQSGLVPVYLEERYADLDKLANVLVMYTIHEIKEQGLFSSGLLDRVDLPSYLNHPQHLEFYGKVNFTKGGVLYSDLISAVGTHHAKEILTEQHGARLEGVLQERAEDLRGITHGIDLRRWDPSKDKDIEEQFDVQVLNGKRKCKAALQRELGLPQSSTKPLLLFAGKLDQDSGLDLVSDILDDLMDIDLQLVILGRGDANYEAAAKSWADEFPEKVALYLANEDVDLKRALAGADIALLPALHYKAQQTHLFAMRFGALNVARSVGAFPDAVSEVEPNTQQGTGFLFENYDADDFYEAVAKALNVFTDQRLWRALVVRAMKLEQSWRAAAHDYFGAYRELILELE